MISVKVAIGIGVSLLAILIGVDVHLAADKIEGNTWSEIIRSWAFKTPLIPWLLGVLDGHFLHWGPKVGATTSPNKIAILFLMTWCVVICSIILNKTGTQIPSWSLGLILLPSFFAGALLWPV